MEHKNITVDNLGCIRQKGDKKVYGFEIKIDTFKYLIYCREYYYYHTLSINSKHSIEETGEETSSDNLFLIKKILQMVSPNQYIYDFTPTKFVCYKERYLIE